MQISAFHLKDQLFLFLLWDESFVAKCEFTSVRQKCDVFFNLFVKFIAMTTFTFTVGALRGSEVSSAGCAALYVLRVQILRLP